MFKAALGLGLGAPLLHSARAATDDPRQIRPQVGDRFVFVSGAKKGAVVTLAELPVGGPQFVAYPMDPAGDTVRDGSRLNQVLLARFMPDELAEETRARAAEGAVAYSAICTHQACPVSMWKKDKQTLYCACHGSQYDPKNGAKVVAGPAPRRLAALPLAIEDGVVVAAGPFIGRVGAKKR